MTGNRFDDMVKVRAVEFANTEIGSISNFAYGTSSVADYDHGLIKGFREGAIWTGTRIMAVLENRSLTDREALDAIAGILDFRRGQEDFNLERARQGDPVRTRGGSPARIVCFDRKNPGNRPLTVLVTEDNGNESVFYYPLSGRARDNGNRDDDDLVMV